MKVLVNALPGRDGGGITYLLEEIRAIEAVAPDITLELFVSPWSYEAVSGAVQSTVRRVPVKTVADRFAFEQTVLRVQARRSDVLYCPLNFGPIWWGGERTVLTLHNPNYFGRGLTMPGTEPARPWWKVKACHAAVRQCNRVVAISEALRDDVVHTLPTAASKVHVVRSGGASWSTVQPEAVAEVPGRFLLAVGSAAPHKRLDQVVEGWSAAVEDSGESISLVIAGRLDNQARRLHRRIAGRAGPLLYHLGDVSNRGQLRWLYEHAAALVSMSVLEAFPLTIGEAGVLGCPLVLSDIPPHREVSLGNARFVPSESPSQLANALAQEFKGHRSSRPWVWPISWEDHARTMVDLFGAVAA